MDGAKAVKTMGLRYAGVCVGCETTLPAGTRAHYLPPTKTVRCLDCGPSDAPPVPAAEPPVAAGARREHARRLDRHQTRVRTAHPRLGGLILALADDPQHLRAWQTGADGEEEFGRRLPGRSGPQLKVLYDRKLPRSAANIDHLAVTSEAVWVLDAKRDRGKVETRGGGLLSTRPPELYVGGRNQIKLVDAVRRQVETVRSRSGSLNRSATWARRC